MQHTQSKPGTTTFWNNDYFKGWREPVEPERFLEFNYGDYPSTQDAKKRTNRIQRSGPFGCTGVILDSFFLNSEHAALQVAIESIELQLNGELPDELQAVKNGVEAEGYNMSDRRVFACLQWLLTANPTEEELAQTYGLDVARKRMEGVEFRVNGVVAFTVTALPEERASD